MESTNEVKNNAVFDKLEKRFNTLKLKETEEKKEKDKQVMIARFESIVKNFESSLYNTLLYSEQLPIKEVALSYKYHMNSDFEEFLYTEYFTNKYPYSYISTEKSKEYLVKITLLDRDRDEFLAKYNIIFE
jgi:hypothetical protein